MNITSTISAVDTASIKRKLGPIMRAKCEQIGRDMVEAANAKMAANFDLDRSYERRRSPGSCRAANALDYVVTETDGGTEVNYRVLGGEDVVRRIVIMNYGSEPHEIGPTGNWDLGGLNPKKVSRAASKANLTGSAGRTVAYGNRLAFPSRDGGYWIGADGQSVDHPGTNGHHFLEEGRNIAAATHI